MSGESAIRRLAYWTIPAGVQDVLRAVRARRLNGNRLDPELTALLRRNAALRDRHKGRRCFILATGPSIKTQDLKLLRDEDCIAVSNFFVHPDCAVIRPRYYCVGGYHPPVTEQAFHEWVGEIEKGTGNATMFFNANDRERCRRDGLFAGRRVHFIQTTGSWDRLLQTGLDLSAAVPAPLTVPIMALEVALYVGYREIYLLGCDHDWILHVNKSAHFYEETQSALVRGGYNEWGEGIDFEAICRACVRVWQQYKVLGTLATRLSGRILNMTPGGLLDVFPRIALETVLCEGEGRLAAVAERPTTGAPSLQ